MNLQGRGHIVASSRTACLLRHDLFIARGFVQPYISFFICCNVTYSRPKFVFLHCFDGVGWATGRASDL